MLTVSIGSRLAVIFRLTIIMNLAAATGVAHK